jgi:group I intron endonuclease
MTESIGGIYMIRSKIKPERFYIGSSWNIVRRFYHHKEDIHNGNHHAIKLQRHVDKYGEDDLEYSIIEQLSCIERQYILEREQSYLDLYKPYFNSTLSAGSLRGFTPSKETIDKRRRSMKGKNTGPQTEEHKRNRVNSRLMGGKGNGLKGKPKPQAVRDKISRTLKERNLALRLEKN